MQNIDAPFFQPDLPDYPPLEQLVRATGPTVATNVYPGVVQQYAGSLAFRDREPCYLTEPNGVSLSPAIYDCRLVGSYLGLPLYATTCCLSGAFSSSSMSG
jgi:hypothetical protein